MFLSSNANKLIAFAMISRISFISSYTNFASRNLSPFSRNTKLRSSTSLAATKTVNLGIFGGGTVGGGIVEILTQKAAHLSQLTNAEIKVSKICVRDMSKPRNFELDEDTVITTNYDDILNDENIDLVVEVMGGTTDAKDVVYKALEAGKDVVTANKALIAACLPEIKDLLMKVNEGREKKVEFRYEAAVCGGIPVIRSMLSDFVGDEISMISGIINGCTNFMLTAMDRDLKSYDDALAEASKLGYAEADPTLDVGGFDARSKLKILMQLAFGIDVDESEISCKGITELTKIDFEYAKLLGGTIKLMGVAKRLPDSNRIAAFVSPTYVKSDETLAAVSGATNAIEVISKNLESTSYIGQGAGRFPTANSCMNDIIAIAKGDKIPLPFNVENTECKFVNDYESLFYIRFIYRDQLGITRQLGEICERNNVSIHSLLQNPIAANKEAAFAIATDKALLSNVKKVCAEIECLDWCRGPSLFMPVLHQSWDA